MNGYLLSEKQWERVHCGGVGLILTGKWKLEPGISRVNGHGQRYN